MGAKNIVYFYEEKCDAGPFSAARAPAVLSEKLNKFRTISASIFKKHGGIRVMDYYKNTEVHVRISFWNSEVGYKNWLLDPENRAYINARSEYLANNNISERLEGPFEINIYD